MPQIDSSGTHVVPTGDFQTLHLGLEGGALEPEARGRAVWTGDCALGFPQHAQDVLALGILQTVICLLRRRLRFSLRISETGTCKAGPWLRMTDRSIRFSSSRIFPGHDQAVRAFMVSLGMVSILSTHAQGKFAHEVADQQGDILAAFAQRGHANGKHAETVEQVAAKRVLGDALGQIPIRSRDQAQVDFDGAIAAQAFELLILQHAQQLGLQVERNLAHLVEKQGSAIRQFQASDFLADRAGKRSLLVAEQLAFQQAGGNGGAVELDEGCRLCGGSSGEWRGRINSLPVPVSPRIRTVASLGATVATWSSTFLSAGLSPTISSNRPCERISPSR